MEPVRRIRAVLREIENLTVREDDIVDVLQAIEEVTGLDLQGVAEGHRVRIGRLGDRVDASGRIVVRQDPDVALHGLRAERYTPRRAAGEVPTASL